MWMPQRTDEPVDRRSALETGPIGWQQPRYKSPPRTDDRGALRVFAATFCRQFAASVCNCNEGRLLPRQKRHVPVLDTSIRRQRHPESLFLSATVHCVDNILFCAFPAD